MHPAKRASRITALVLYFLTLLTAPSPAHAHGISASFTTVTITEGSVVVEVGISVADAIAHFQLDTNADQRISPQELRTAVPQLATFLNEHLVVALDNRSVRFEHPVGRIESLAAGQELVILREAVPVRVSPNQITVACGIKVFEMLGQSHANLVKIVNGDAVQTATLTIGHREQRFLTARERPLADQLREFLVMGIKHIFLGYDHIMFLLAVIIFGGPFLRTVKIVTAFTIAHSITLILAALQIVTLPSRLIESSIAVSIAYVAIENCFIQKTDHRWMITFTFGLVHGFGFANVLRQLGLPTKGLVSSLLSFNAGVELGQLGIVLLLLPLIGWLGRQAYHQRAMQAISLIIGAFGIGWFIERAFGLAFMPF